MTKEQEEGNEIIAKYRGAKYEQLLIQNQPDTPMVWKYEKTDPEYIPGHWVWYTMHELQYHSNWNWLIPIVKKVQKDLWDKLGNPYMREMVKRELDEALNKLEIESLYQEVVNAIQVLNSNRDANK